MSAWCRIMRCMPRARQMVTIAGSPSGTAAIARLTATMKRLTMSLLLGLQVGDEAVLERVGQMGIAEQAIDEHHGADGQACRAEDLAEVGQLALQRRLLVLERLQHFGDQADLGVHAGGRDQPAAAPVGHQRPHECRVGAIAQRDLLVQHDVRVLFDRYRLAGERGFLDLEVHGLHQPAGRRARNSRLPAARCRRRRVRDWPRRPGARRGRPPHSAPTSSSAPPAPARPWIPGSRRPRRSAPR